MTKMEIMQSLVEANMTRGVMVDKIENCCQSILMQGEQIKAMNKKLAREKSDAQVIVERSANDAKKEIEGFRKEIEDLITMGGSIGGLNHQ